MPQRTDDLQGADPGLAGRGDLRELRLALVLPGGVSLAIYIHGVVAEIHRLVRASAIDERGVDAGRISPSGSVYRELLSHLGEREKDEVRTRVVVDVVSGTSAGGINAIFLAKALAHGLPMEFMRDVWIKQADIKKLMRGPTFLPRRLRLPWLVLTLPRRSPLRGATILRWFIHALEEMDAAGPQGARFDSLIPRGQQPQLFVTLTDLAGLPTNGTLLGPKLTHRQVLSFRYAPGETDDFAREANGALAFAARATASFPAAFPLARLDDVKRVLGAQSSQSVERLSRTYALQSADAESTAFIDGGILDNRPSGRPFVELHRLHRRHGRSNVVSSTSTPSRLLLPPTAAGREDSARIRYACWAIGGDFRNRAAR